MKKQNVWAACAVLVSMLCLPSVAMAATQGSGGTLFTGITALIQDIVQFLTGPMGLGVLTIALVLVAYKVMSGEGGNVKQQGFQILIAGVVLFAAPQIASAVITASGAVL